MSQPKFDAHEMRVPLDKCKLYPGMPLRFDMDVPRIGESIHLHGQQEPGTAIKKGDEYLISDGRRRLLGCNYAREKYGSPSTYWARVYEDLDEVQIVTLAFIKNDERKSLSLLEEVDYFGEASKKFGAKAAAEIGIRAGRQPEYMKRVIELCGWIGDKLAKLHKIEMKTEHRFKVTHLESLSAYRNEENTFYQMAAVAAARKIDPSEVDPRGIKSLVKYYAPWFEQELPEYGTVPKATKVSIRVDDHATVDNKEIDALSEQISHLDSERSAADQKVRTQGHPLTETEPMRASPRHLQDDVYFAECPFCGAWNPFQFRWKDPEVIFISTKGDGNLGKEASVPDSIYSAEHRCVKTGCGKAFRVIISPKGHNTLGIASYRKVILPKPQKAYTGQILVWDASRVNAGREADAWLVVSHDRKAHFIDGKLIPIKD